MIKITKDTIKKELKKYANRWEITSKEYEDNNIYEWLLSNLRQEFHSILEIGCGTGISITKLIEKADRIISIDDNIECLKKTYELLKSMNIDVELIKRGSLLIKSDKQFSESYSNTDLKKYNESKVILLQGDLLNDTNLIHILEDNFAFDLVTCWFIGTNTIKQFNSKINEIHITSDQLYREAVQKAAYKIYKITKAKDGIMQIADRLDNYDKNFIKQHYNWLFDNNAMDDEIKSKNIFIANKGGIKFVKSNNGDFISKESENLSMTCTSCIVKL